MVVQIDACRFTPAAIPLEDEPPLLVDADRMEAFKIAAQLFLIMSALEKSGPAFLVPGRSNRDPIRTLTLRRTGTLPCHGREELFVASMLAVVWFVLTGPIR